jgi:transposase
MSVFIGIDPHKASHMAVAIDGNEQSLGVLEVMADGRQTPRLLAWAELLSAERTWAIESAGGLGKLLSQELVAAGEHVVDVPPTLSARVRLLESSNTTKNDRLMHCQPRSRGSVTALLRTVGHDGHAMAAPCRSLRRSRRGAHPGRMPVAGVAAGGER